MTLDEAVRILVMWLSDDSLPLNQPVEEAIRVLRWAIGEAEMRARRREMK